VGLLKKKAEDITFQEFWEEAEKQGEKSEVEEEKQLLFKLLYAQGFTVKQVTEMKMQEVMKFCLRARADIQVARVIAEKLNEELDKLKRELRRKLKLKEMAERA